ncbi:hypothetical protein AAG570_013063 [Ranatra chinensis]|uniref:Dynein heavy chain linker domain-containing protein n=1 Tax=Ranatra chinensis TaxID=642074 RepID=A0ABD0YFQ1_9HEMI
MLETEVRGEFSRLNIEIRLDNFIINVAKLKIEAELQNRLFWEELQRRLHSSMQHDLDLINNFLQRAMSVLKAKAHEVNDIAEAFRQHELILEEGKKVEELKENLVNETQEYYDEIERFKLNWMELKPSEKQLFKSEGSSTFFEDSLTLITQKKQQWGAVMEKVLSFKKFPNAVGALVTWQLEYNYDRHCWGRTEESWTPDEERCVRDLISGDKRFQGLLGMRRTTEWPANSAAAALEVPPEEAGSIALPLAHGWEECSPASILPRLYL